MTTGQPADQVRSHVHSMWASVAEQWGVHADYVDERGVEVTAAMLDAAALGPGDHVLELACGPGGAGIAAAQRVLPGGSVVLSDVVTEMATIAGARAKERGLTNVTATTIDLEAIDAGNESFDVVLCRDGLMFAVDPERAVGEIHRVLKPGGRVAVAVWGASDDNPWLGVVFEAVTGVTGFPVPPPGIPGPFSLGDANRLREMFIAAGFGRVAVDRLATPLRSPSFDDWWARIRAIAEPLSAILDHFDQETLQSIEARMQLAVAPYATAAGLELPGLTLLVSATR